MSTATQVRRWLDANLHRFELPVQYLGDEPNTERRDWDTASVRWCLVASWPYEQAAGNQSIPAVAKAIHTHRPDFLADRAFLPVTPRDLRLLERAGIGMFGIESKHPLRDFDLVASSISYPVLAMSYVKMLTMSGIAARWTDRDPDTNPMVMVGGQSYGCPEVLAPVVDAWWLGEVEDEPGNPGIGAVTTRIAEYKYAGVWHTDRLGCYADLARSYPFLYFPRFVQVHYRTEDRTHVGAGPHPSKQVSGYSSTLTGMRLPLRRRIVHNLDNVTGLDDPPLLYADPAMGSGDLEVGRGCPAWCSFCALTYRQKPYRQRSVGYVTDLATRFARNMGSVRLAPFSPDFPMHTQRKALVSALLENVSDEVDAATMRVDDFIADPQFLLLQVHGGMDAVTLGVEGSSQRMRDLVGKGVADADIITAVTRGIRAGIRKFKLYLIGNLPGEDEGDLFRVVRLAKDLADVRESMGQPTVRIQFSWTPLIVEANTPFQWFAATVPNRLLSDVWEECRAVKVEFKLGAKSEPNRFAFFQTCQRASREVGEALVDAMVAVDRACWGGVPRTFGELLEAKLRERGFANGYADIFDERGKADMFGWEFIDQGISAELLWNAHLQMVEFIENTDSHTYDDQFGPDYHGSEWIERCDTRCHGKTCGACDTTDLKIRNGYIRAVDRAVDLGTLRPVDQRTQAVRVRARIHTGPQHRFVDNRHWRFAVRRAAFRAQHRLDTGWGIAKRSIRFASDDAAHRDYTCGVDYVEFGLTARVGAEAIGGFLDAMNDELAHWMRISDWVLHPATAVTLRAAVASVFYQLDLDSDPAAVAARLAAFHASAHVPMRLRVDGGYFAPAAEDVNARDHVDDVWLAADGTRPVLRMLVRGRPGPYDVYAALTGHTSWGETTRLIARRLDAFVDTDRAQADFLRPDCRRCGLGIPVTVLDRPWHPTHCPHCLDLETA